MDKQEICKEMFNDNISSSMVTTKISDTHSQDFYKSTKSFFDFYISCFSGFNFFIKRKCSSDIHLLFIIIVILHYILTIVFLSVVKTNRFFVLGLFNAFLLILTTFLFLSLFTELSYCLLIAFILIFMFYLLPFFILSFLRNRCDVSMCYRHKCKEPFSIKNNKKENEEKKRKILSAVDENVVTGFNYIKDSNEIKQIATELKKEGELILSSQLENQADNYYKKGKELANI